jgi:hypothetical protein
MMTNKKLAILVLAAMFAVAAKSGESKNAKLLPEGFVLPGSDGKLVADSNSGKWFFELDAEVRDNLGSFAGAGARLELLPSASLEKMLADAKGRAVGSYRLWGRITKCWDKNFVFPIYFLPMSKVQPAGGVQPQQQSTEAVINEPNDLLTIPEEVVAKLSSRKIVGFQEATKGLELKTDSILADRTAVLTKQPDCSYVFAFDALGRKVGRDSIKLLPCGAMEEAQQRQAFSPETLRFRISGIVTRFKGESYLLLQRATPAYGHGNFDR